MSSSPQGSTQAFTSWTYAYRFVSPASRRIGSCLIYALFRGSSSGSDCKLIPSPCRGTALDTRRVLAPLRLALYAHAHRYPIHAFRCAYPPRHTPLQVCRDNPEMMEYRLLPTIFAEETCPPTILFFIFERCKKKIVQHPTYDLFP